MSEDLTERLSRFTPDGGALDRDAVLFAAGRASARPNRRWVALAGALAASQLLTLVLLWPRPVAPGVAPVADSTPPAVAQAPPDDPAPQPADGSLASWVLWQQDAGAQTDLPPLRPVADLRPDAPPLRAGLALSDALPY
jgi:hypothetical protein